MIHLSTDIYASKQLCFDLSRSIDLHVESMHRSRERAVAGMTSGLIGLDEEVTWEARHFGVRWRMTSRITEFDSPHRFVDEMVRGPFSTFRHEHLFEPISGGTRMKDVADYRTRFGLLRPIADRVAGAYLRKLLVVRNEEIRSQAENAKRRGQD